MAESTFYTRVRGKISGPFDVIGLQRLVRRGMLSRIHEISEDRATWHSAGEYEDLFPDKAAARLAAAPEPAGNGDIALAEASDAYDAPIAVAPMPPVPGGGSPYYYAQNGAAVGPVPLAVLASLAQNGTLRGDELVWREGDPSGTPARQIPSLAAMYSTHLNYAAPSRRGQDTYAGFWRRFGAWVVDAIIYTIGAVIASMGIGFVIGAIMASGNAQGSDIYSTGVLIGYVIGVVVPWFYYAFFESSAAQATPGKMAVGILVSSDLGERISFSRATGRYFGKYISALILCFGFFMAGWTEKKQALHDMMAGCLVVNK